MAADNATMTPEQAIAVLGETRQYRETLTARAVGIIWLVWGAMLALLTTADMALYFGAELADISFPNGLMFAFTALFVGLGGAITNLVWRAHAL